MHGNVQWVRSSPEEGSRVRVLDDSLMNYGLQRGTEVAVMRNSGASSIPVWSLEGGLHARLLEASELGWVTAYTPFGIGGKICFILDPSRARKIEQLGFIEVRT